MHYINPCHFKVFEGKSPFFSGKCVCTGHRPEIYRKQIKKHLVALVLFAHIDFSQAADLKFDGARLTCMTRTADLTSPILDVSVLPDGSSVIVRNTQKPNIEPGVFTGKLDAVEFNGVMAVKNIKLKLFRLSGLIEIEKPKNPVKWLGRCAQAPIF
jgi:hypothetical protein